MDNTPLLPPLSILLCSGPAQPSGEPPALEAAPFLPGSWGSCFVGSFREALLGPAAVMVASLLSSILFIYFLITPELYYSCSASLRGMEGLDEQDLILLGFWSPRPRTVLGTWYIMLINICWIHACSPDWILPVHYLTESSKTHTGLPTLGPRTDFSR